MIVLESKAAQKTTVTHIMNNAHISDAYKDLMLKKYTNHQTEKPVMRKYFEIVKLFISVIWAIFWIALLAVTVYEYLQGKQPDNFVVLTLILSAIAFNGKK